MSGFDEVLGVPIEIKRTNLSDHYGNDLDKDTDSNNSDLLLPEFRKLLSKPLEDEDIGFALPGAPEDEFLLDAKELFFIPSFHQEVLRHQLPAHEDLDDDDIVMSTMIESIYQEVLRHRLPIHDDLDDDDIVMSTMAQSAYQTAEELVQKVWEEVSSWKVQPFSKLPKWLQDNDFLHNWHRPPLPSFRMCFRSIFRIHTETGNIWTHLLGCIAFMGIMLYFLCASAWHSSIGLEEKLVFTAFFIGAILCLGFSFMFHTVSCHSEFVGKLFSKLDYCGIAILIMGSFVPWLYYGFYCDFQPKLIYLTSVVLLGITTIVVSLWDKFSTPKYRGIRASVFLTFGLSGIIPAVHYTLLEGWDLAITKASLGWLILMGSLYVLGAILYAIRVPERFFPGKCDLWFQSHQIFHVLVLAAAFVHYHGISEMAMYRLTHADCTAENLQRLAQQDVL